MVEAVISAGILRLVRYFGDVTNLCGGQWETGIVGIIKDLSYYKNLHAGQWDYLQKGCSGIFAMELTL